MHWLQALDTALFHFINGTLTNPLFDWLMPIVSGSDGAMHWFMLAVVLAFAAALIFGDARARLCAVMIALAVAIGDGLIVNTIKHAVQRPRPCIALPDVVERLGCTTSGSMPSAHAANWFAATMIVFIFYRRKLWLMLPVFFMAVAVGFSRIYNGVHYPGDVLAGAILGSGYAAAIAVVLQMGWQYVGRAWFPLWHAQMPSLLNPQAHSPQREETSETDDSHWLRLGCLVIAASLIGRWVYIDSGHLGLSGDEAYQWLCSKHLALSYANQPPGIAWIQFAGTRLWGDTELGVRFFSPLFTAILSWMALRFVSHEVGAKIAFWFLLILTVIPLLGIGSVLITSGTPLVLCGMWALIAGWRAVQPEGQTRDWLSVGVAMGLAFLCNYSALYQIICFGIFFWLWRPARWQLRKPGPWLALGIFVVCTLPVMIWNAEHGWIALQHIKAHAGVYSGEFLGCEAAWLNPIFFIAALWAMFGFWKFRRERPLMLYLFCMYAPILLALALYSFRAPTKLEWIAPAVLPMFLLMAVYWNERLRTAAHFIKPVLAAGLALGFAMVVLMYDSDLVSKIAGEDLPARLDPSRRLQAWSPAAQGIEAEREKLAAQGTSTFIIGDNAALASLCTFYSPPARKAIELIPLVYCVDSDTPENQFCFWPEYNYRAARQGENAIYVTDIGLGRLEPGWFGKWLRHEEVSTSPAPQVMPPDYIVSEFKTVKDLGVREVEYKGRIFHRVHLWACYDLK